MLIGHYLRSLLAPGRSRWKPMMLGLALFAAGVGAAVSLQPPGPVAAALILLALAAWLTGACAMVGYVRWFIGSEIAQARRDHE
jgi:hypothetical protein